MALQVGPRHDDAAPRHVFDHASAVRAVCCNVGNDFNPSDIAGTHVKHADGRGAAGFKTESRFGQQRRTDSVDVFEEGRDCIKGLTDVKWREIRCCLAEFELEPTALLHCVVQNCVCRIQIAGGCRLQRDGHLLACIVELRPVTTNHLLFIATAAANGGNLLLTLQLILPQSAFHFSSASKMRRQRLRGVGGITACGLEQHLRRLTCASVSEDNLKAHNA